MTTKSNPPAPNPANLPREKMFELYWLGPGITENPKSCAPWPPVSDILKPLPNGMASKPDIVTIAYATLSEKFEEPYIGVGSIYFKKDKTSKANEAAASKNLKAAVKLLQENGIKVMVSVGNSENGLAWGNFEADQNETFAKWVAKYFVGSEHGFGLDGISIDDEQRTTSAAKIGPTFAALRRELGADVIINKALWQDNDEMSAIKDYIDYGSLMNYFNSTEQQIDYYYQYTVENGLANDQVAIGVLAGPQGTDDFQITSLEVTRELSAWEPSDGNPKDHKQTSDGSPKPPKQKFNPGNKRGMMLYTFSQDRMCYENLNVSKKFHVSHDHMWQKMIQEVLGKG